MKKILLFTPDIAEDVDTNLTLLGQLGVMHITPFQPPKDQSIDRVDNRIKQMRTAIDALNSISDIHPHDLISRFSGNEELFSVNRAEVKLMEKVLDAENQRVELSQRMKEMRDAVRWYGNWGKVGKKELEMLRKAGIFVRLFLLDSREYKEISNREDIHKIGMINDKYQVAQITEENNSNIAFLEIRLPEYPWEGIEDVITQTNEDLKQVRDLLLNLTSKTSILEEALEERNRRFNVRNVQYGGIVLDDLIRCWRGYIPENDINDFVKVADDNSWGYIISEPEQEEIEEVPTLIRSPRWAERIKPVMNFMGLIPGYKELDVSKIFMLFFTFFTGILVGDAGYGLVFLLLTLLVHSRQNFKKKTEFGLFYTLSVSIMVWGILTGTYFGSPAIAELTFLKFLKIDAIASFGGDKMIVQKLMFLIGALHLSIGRLQLAFKYINSIRAISQLGWIAIIWGLNMIVNQMVLGITAPSIMVWLFIGGSVLIALFSNAGKDFFTGVISSISSLPLSIINGFSDIISYIRLYAVGLATVLMATSFNQMALGDGITTIASAIGAVLVLILGHGLNMILAGMAVIVHGVRLNMLEYAGHAEMEFSGIDYKPYRLKNSKQYKT